ncbi:OmpW/AlkL family protein [Burkholderia cenocepacia]|uniref:OmpW family protein n=1 Tax=Burkholderia cenocepacia TaxID=95486 RepID=A0A3Q9F6I2_9BURK|nr:OmpW family outer membrane protein [Burkholderia cenocepacia]AZQ53767.1 OmpW family protein [Burkholderia cenocepacia]
MWNGKRTTRALGMAVGMGISIASLADDAHAQAAGSVSLGVGWLHIMPQSSSGELFVQSVAGAPVNRALPDTGGRVATSDALSLMAEYQFTDHVGIAFLAGTPFTSDMVGDRSLARYGVIGQAKPLAPVLALRYHFLAADARFRPFVGVGVNYTWYIDTHITNKQFLDGSCGPGCTTRSSLSASWNPAFEAGFNVALSKHLGINVSAMVIPMSTTLTTDARNAAGTHDVTTLRLHTNPLVTHLDLVYSF